MPRGSLPDWVVLSATFLPALGILLTAWLAITLRGSSRWLALLTAPGLVLLLAWWLSPAVLYDGNLLAALLLAIYYVVLILYYPSVLVVGLVVLHRRRGDTG